MDHLTSAFSASDRPWLQHYTEKEINAPLPHGSLYEYMHSRNADRMDAPAITFMGCTITHRQFDDKITACARALVASGVSKGDIISICMLTAPEALILLYAANRIGAICSFIVFNATEADIRRQIIEAESRIVFTVDLASEKIHNAIQGTSVEKTVVVPLSCSMSPLMRIAVNLKRRNSYSPADFIPWKTFLMNGKDCHLPEIYIDENDIALLEYTSGTTGESKGAMLSNLAINSAAFNYTQTSKVLEFHDGETFLCIVVPFFSFGLITTMIMPLCTRLHLILSPDPSPENMPQKIIKYKPNHFVSGSLHIDAIIKNPKINKMDLSFLSTAGYGGEKIDAHWEQTVSEFFFSHGMTHELQNGYGMTEVSGSFCTTTHKTKFMIPFAKNNVMITDIDTDEPLGFDQEGQICLSGPSLMAGYFKRPEATAEVMFEKDGVKWLKTGDLGKVSSDGSFSVTGRLKRILYSVGENGVYRIFPMKVEAVICSCSDVAYCGVVGRKDKNKGFLLIAYIVLKDPNADRNAVAEKLKSICEDNLSATSLPNEYNFIDAMPTTRAGKIDFNKLEMMANS